MIKPYEPRHLEPILEHQKELYGLNFKELKYDYFFYVGIMNWYEQVGTEMGYDAFVYEVNGKVEGFYLIHHDQDSRYLMQMFVSSSYRQKGVGHQLLLHVEEQAKKNSAKQVLLEVSDINPSAVSFYKNHGFSSIGENYDENMDIRYFMQKNIS